LVLAPILVAYRWIVAAIRASSPVRMPLTRMGRRVLARSHATARRVTAWLRRPTTASACKAAPVMSLSLAEARATPKPPSAFAAPTSQATVALAGETWAERSASTPKVV